MSRTGANDDAGRNAPRDPDSEDTVQTLEWYRSVRVAAGLILAAGAVFALLLTAVSIVEYELPEGPYPVVMAVPRGFISLIPSVGVLLAPLVVAIPRQHFGSTKFTQISPLAFTVLITAFDVIVTQASYNFVMLSIIGKAVKQPISVVLVAVLVSLDIGSILSAFLVVPLVAIAPMVVCDVLANSRLREPFPDVTMRASP